jgi:cold shock CspA family protein
MSSISESSSPSNNGVSQSQTESERLTGQVKWFNTKAGYGFITGCNGAYNGQDIFVHFSSIKVTNSQYRYLVQGEYVEFDVVKPEGDKHENHAINVSGLYMGPIMCEAKRAASLAGEGSSRPRPTRRLRVNRRDFGGERESGDKSERSRDNRSHEQVQSDRRQRSSNLTSSNDDGYTRVNKRRPRDDDRRPRDDDRRPRDDDRRPRDDDRRPRTTGNGPARTQRKD